MALGGMSETIKRSPHMKLLIECSCNHAELVRFLRAHFKHISVVGMGELGSGLPPELSNLWAYN